MNLKTRPLLIAASLGGILQLVVALAVQTLSFFTFSQSLSDAPSLNAMLLPAIAAWTGNCLCTVMLDILTGATYSWLYPREEALTPGDGILGGGIASALARVGSGAIGIFIGLLFLPLVFSRLGLELPTNDLGPILALSMAQGVIGGIIGLVVSAVLAALFGAVGGGIIALIRERRSGQLAGAGLL